MTRTTRRSRSRGPAVEVEAVLLDWGDRGFVRADIAGRPALIDRGLPGERVLARIQPGRHPRRGLMLSVLEASAVRVTPPCPYYAAGCGGCQWQHMAYDAQLNAKRDLVNREMAGAGIDARVNDVHGMDDPWRYRQTASLAIGWEAGFRPRGRRGIIEIHDCAISHPLIGRFASSLNMMLRDRRIPNYHGKLWLDCTVVGSEDKPALQVLIQGIEGLTLESHPELPEVAEALAGQTDVESVAFRSRSGDAVPLVGALTSSIEIAGRWMRVPAGAFVQTNIRMLEALMSRLIQRAGQARLRAGADIYSGIGTFGLPLARQLDQMTVIELDGQAVGAARETGSAWGLTNVDFLASHAERALPTLPPIDLAVVDPARSGLVAAVVDALVEKCIPLLFYVSCSPRSLARDLALLVAGGYQVESLDVFDFYPHTYHVESLAVLCL